MAITVFPLELRQSTSNWSYMSFWVHPKGANDQFTDEFIYLPIPTALTFSDSMEYNNLDLGILGDIGVKLVEAANVPQAKGKGVLRTGGDIIGGMVNSIINKAESGNTAAALSIVSRKAGGRGENTANIIDYGTKQVISPNSRTRFQNSTIRSFAFQFKMVGRTHKDTLAIKTICEIFQQYMYPEGTDLLLKYPPTWQVRFFDGKGQINSYIPGIYELYLTSLTTTFNSSTNIFRDDGSPVEVDVSLGFQETKALTRQEIMALRGGGKVEVRVGMPAGGWRLSNE